MKVLLAFLVFINVTIGAHIFVNLIVAVTVNALVSKMFVLIYARYSPSLLQADDRFFAGGS